MADLNLNSSSNTLENYKSSKYSFPAEDVDPKDKLKPQWCLDYAKAIYSLYVRDLSGIRYSRQADYNLYRLYAEGRQPTEKYMDILCPKGKDGQREGYMNISWDILSVAPKFRSIVTGMFERFEHDIVCEAVDEKSGLEKKNMEFEIMAEDMMQKMVGPYDQVATDEKQFPVMPDSVEEIEMYKNIGAFKLKHEIALEKTIQHCFNLSGWKNIKKRVYEDLFDLGLAAVRDYTDKDTGIAKCEYVDPHNLVIRYSDDPYFKNIDYVGEIKDYTISKLRDEVGSNISYEELEEIIKSNISRYNQNYDWQRYDDVYTLYDKYSDLVVKVLDVAWYSMDTHKGEKRKTSRGDELFFKTSYKAKTKKTDKKEVIESHRTNVYKAKWIVGSDYVFDYGQLDDIVTRGKYKPVLPISVIKYTNRSMVAQMITVLDSIQLTWLKIQNEIAKAAPSGLAIDVDALKNVADGHNQLTPLKILEIRRQTGDLLFSSTTHMSQVMNPNAGKPVQEISGGVGAALNELIGKFNADLATLRQITGISEVMDGSAPAASALVGTSQMSAQATNNILYNIFLAYSYIKETAAKNIGKRIQITARYKDITKTYTPAIGRILTEAIDISKDLSLAEMGITINARPNDEEKANIIQAAQNALGKGIIQMSDYLFVTRQINAGGNLKYVEAYLANKERKAMEMQQQLQEQNMQLNQQGMLASEQQKAQTEASLKQMDTQGKIEVERAKSLFRMEEEDNRHDNKIEQDTNKGKSEAVIQDMKNETAEVSKLGQS